MSSHAVSRIPKIHLLCMQEHFADAFKEASRSRKLPASVEVQIHDCALAQLPSSVQFDAIVSPANSYGRLDGAFDDAISRALSPRDDYLALTHVSFKDRSRNIWGTRYVALCPTMRMPNDVRWDREVVYECIWSLLCEVDNHNKMMEMGHPREYAETIQNILMTPLATGVGRVSATTWANQAVLAIKHFVEAAENPDKWSALDWQDFGRPCAEVQLTWEK
ncbi:hypothetical protein BGZ61DRAFT_465759 [Ilyonectria robusta]|uniref:uncharacterized protein n=1 Tax=Ilyonectria robusta TaxID=1079257 RepID=UPI001E8E9E37|nr:uncharacterized protein BGZ61DRAFT_465759 [Ilyonectria robusta]KAH8658520.1 hypothetical protein BGZ61DRAFT_465759 [Ilyonectria robusta]